MNVTTIGIDPGSTGAAAILHNAKYVDCIDWSRSNKKIIRRFREWTLFYSIDLVAIEMVGAGAYGFKICQKTGKRMQRKMGASSAFTFGSNFGGWKMLLDCFELPWRSPRPQEWQPGLLRKKYKSSDKPSLAKVKRMFPEAPVTLKKHSGRSDAIMLAYWAHLKLTRP